MSYTLIIQPAEKAFIGQAIEAARVNDADDQPAAELAEHLAAIKLAVAALLPVVGGPDQTVQVEISGNAMADHDTSEADEVVHLVVRVPKA